MDIDSDEQQEEQEDLALEDEDAENVSGGAVSTTNKVSSPHQSTTEGLEELRR
jgi:hypothetical protein